MINNYLSIPYCSITPTTVTFFSELVNEFGKPVRCLHYSLPESNVHKGTLSKKSYSRIYKRVFTYLYNVDREILFSGKGREKVGFLTLTLPSSQVKKFHKNYVEFLHSDQEIKSKCLNQFFIELAKKYDVSQRVWKAEKQFNGNIHFHILVDKFIPHGELRQIWNRIINKLGYVDRYRQQMKDLTEKQYIEHRLKDYRYPLSQPKREKLIIGFKKAYQEGKETNWFNPNTTDIHSLYKDNKGKSITNVVSYIAKYMSKDEQEGKQWGFDLSYVTGRIWYCSQLISKACKVVVDVSDELYAAFENMCKKLKDTYVITDDYFTVACQSIVKASKKGIKEFENIFSDNLKMLSYGSG